MKYTNYYSQLLKAKGTPQMSVSQHQHIMNIIFVEGSIFSLDKLKCSADTQPNKNKAIYQLSSKLYNLTKSQPPETLFQQILNGTR